MAGLNFKKIQSALTGEIAPAVAGGAASRGLDEIAPAMQAKVPAWGRALIKIGLAAAIPNFTKMKAAKPFCNGLAGHAGSQLLEVLVPDFAKPQAATAGLGSPEKIEEEFILENMSGAEGDPIMGAQNEQSPIMGVGGTMAY